MLQALPFVRCHACSKIVTSLSAGQKHHGCPSDQPLQPMERRARTEAALWGNIQPDTAVIAEVTNRYSQASPTGVLLILKGSNMTCCGSKTMSVSKFWGVTQGVCNGTPSGPI